MSAELLHDLECCVECGFILTDEEKEYYQRPDGYSRCEKCVRLQHERIERWREGGEDAELDALFGHPSGRAQ